MVWKQWLGGGGADETFGAPIIIGEGRAFCVGLDLDPLEPAIGDLDYVDATVARMNRIITSLEMLPIPTITANNGFTRTVAGSRPATSPGRADGGQ